MLTPDDASPLKYINLGALYIPPCHQLFDKNLWKLIRVKKVKHFKRQCGDMFAQ